MGLTRPVGEGVRGLRVVERERSEKGVRWWRVAEDGRGKVEDGRGMVESERPNSRQTAGFPLSCEEIDDNLPLTRAVRCCAIP